MHVMIRAAPMRDHVRIPCEFGTAICKCLSLHTFDDTGFICFNCRFVSSSFYYTLPRPHFLLSLLAPQQQCILPKRALIVPYTTLQLSHECFNNIGCVQHSEVFWYSPNSWSLSTNIHPAHQRSQTLSTTSVGPPSWLFSTESSTSSLTTFCRHPHRRRCLHARFLGWLHLQFARQLVCCRSPLQLPSWRSHNRGGGVLEGS